MYQIGNQGIDQKEDHNAKVIPNVGLVTRPRAILDHFNPILDDLNPVIVALKIQATHFDLKPVMFNILNSIGQFGGMPNEDVMQHIHNFWRAWLSGVLSGSMKSWGDICKSFLFHYNHPNMNTQLRNDIASFHQADDESMIANNDYQFPSSRLGIRRKSPGAFELNAKDCVCAQLSAITNMLKNLQCSNEDDSTPTSKQVEIELQDEIIVDKDKDGGSTSEPAEHKKALGWKMADLKGISPIICMHKILLEECHGNYIEQQQRLNPVVKKVRCMQAILSDMVENFLEIFMDGFSVSEDDCERCLVNLAKVLKRCEEVDLVLRSQLRIQTPTSHGSRPNRLASSELGLSYNSLSGRIPTGLYNCKELQFLSLSINQLEIGLDANQLSGHLPSNMGFWLPNLEELCLADNQLVGSFPVSISIASQLTLLDMPYTCLEALDIGGNTVIGSKLPGLVGNLSGSLWEFSAYGCNIRGGIPSEIGNLSNLINIELAGNELTGMIPATFGALKELQSDYLMENMFVGSIPSELSNLAYLNLTSNKLSGPIPSCLGNLSSLRNLLVGSNMFSSSISSTLTRLTDLLILNLSSNSLSGPLPIDIGKWKVLTSMDLSNNRFSGDIPIGVADLKDLTQFSLSNNRLAGSIPTSFGDMLSLKFLDLSRNNLSGEIPKSFDVSFNRLEGEVPEGESFGRYSIESFKGNKALCGAPQLHLPSCKTKPLKSSKAKAKLIIYVAMSIASTILVMALIIIILRSRQRRYKLTTREDLLPLGTWRRISYHELHRATDGFSENNLLVLRNIRNRILIKIISSCSDDLNFKALLLEFMPNGSLDEWLYSSIHFLNILQRLNILIDVVSALEYLHHEYGTEGIVSTKGDVYSFGILVMETVTRKKPTAEMFAGERSLKNWVKESISTLYQVVDNNLLSTIGREHAAANNCALSVLQIGLECSAELPDERLDMKESVPKLNKIRAKYLNDTELLRLRHHR
ncbi:hypothetical protein F3Y22_tig00110457pilonHSYRG00080 [Hibiscus syriacus]|uniref:Tyrosine-protein kinase catalytic domain-containing protein n=1 Tax=Hibiscus syriacus TaxID=106335 RepID=A0A6A3ANG8_HIBSY|nr:hypothetical protein F3Y22_tig00110457pilonHSYRG00080 [Hibiscus syriacus]